MYRTQVYQDTSRVAGPYLPPYPLQGLGATDCASLQAQYDQWLSDYNGFKSSYNPNEPADAEILAKMEANLQSTRNELSACQGQSGGDSPNPWGKFSENTVNLQDYINQQIQALIAAGNPDGTVCYLQKDGILGATTCGAAKQTGSTVPSTCKSFTVSRCPSQMPSVTPVKPGGGGGSPQVLPVTPPVNPAAPCASGLIKGPGGSCVLPAKPASSTNMWLWIGIAAAAGVGGLILWKRQRKGR